MIEGSRDTAMAARGLPKVSIIGQSLIRMPTLLVPSMVWEALYEYEIEETREMRQGANKAKVPCQDSLPSTVRTKT